MLEIRKPVFARVFLFKSFIYSTMCPHYIRFLMMKSSLLLISLLLCFFASLSHAQTTVYYWVDKEGKTYFSDTFAPGAEQITVENKNLISINPVNKTQATTQTLSEIDDLSLDRKQEIKYQAKILFPQNDMALRSNNGTLDVYVSTIPGKNSTQRLQLFLDAQPLGSPQIPPTIRVFNVDRGTHQIQVQLVDETGNTLAKTQIITVHLQRATLN